jgi:hypothetical protein
MKVHYKIVEVWPQDHLIVARYWTDLISEIDLASDPSRKDDGTPWRCRTDVSISLQVPAPQGEELETIILRNAPIGFLKTLEAVKDPNTDTSLDHIKTMLGVTVSKDESELDKFIPAMPTPTISAQLSDDEIRDLIAKVTAAQ